MRFQWRPGNGVFLSKHTKSGHPVQHLSKPQHSVIGQKMHLSACCFSWPITNYQRYCDLRKCCTCKLSIYTYSDV